MRWLTGSCLVGRYPWAREAFCCEHHTDGRGPALSDEERLERRRRFIERVLSPDVLDRDTLERIEQLTDNES
jgi:hypothetical protein